MAKAKAQAIKFAHTDKKRVRGKKGHTRTGACTCRWNQRCQHGTNDPTRQKK